MGELGVIQGGVAKDERGQIRFVNEFDMSSVKRFYIIQNANTELIRGWRGHRIEQRWFYVLSGAFGIDIVKIDNWNTPSPDLPVDRKILTGFDMQVLNIPAGYGTAFQALESGSELLVYADYPISHAIHDDYTWALDYFKKSKIGAF